jgi:hypothetical protein
MPRSARVEFEGGLYHVTEIAHPDAMDARLFRKGFRAFDIGRFAEPLRQRFRDNVVELARESGVEIEYLSRSKGVRKEELVVESCTTFKPWRNPKTSQPGLKMQTGNYSTYYFYLIDPEMGLMQRADKAHPAEAAQTWAAQESRA